MDVTKSKNFEGFATKGGATVIVFRHIAFSVPFRLVFYLSLL